MTRSLARWLVGHRAAGWMLFAALSAAAGLGLSRLEFDDDLHSTFRDRTPSGELMADSFPYGDNAFLILVEGADLFAPDTVAALRAFDFSLRETEGVGQVVSLFDLRSREEIDGYHPPLMPGTGDSPAAHEKAREEALGHPLARGVLLGGNGGSLLFFAEPLPELRRVEDLRPVEEELRRAAGELADSAGLEVVVSGIPSLRAHVVETSRREQIRYSVGGGVLGILIAWVVFRSSAVLLITLPVPLFAAAWSVGALGLVGEPVNPMNNMIIILVMVIALTDSIHLVFGIRRHIAAGEPPPLAAVNGLAEVGPPCFLTSLTTAAAFASLCLSSNQVVMRFGLACAAGTLLVFLAAVLYIPLVASTRIGGRILPPGKARSWPAGRALGILSVLASRFRWPLAIAGLAITLGAGLLFFRAEADYRYRENVDRDSPHWKAVERIDAEFGGSQPLHVLVQRSGSRDSPAAFLPVLRDVHGALLGSGATGRPVSLLNLVEAMGATAEGEAVPWESLAERLPEGALSAFYHSGNRVALVTAPLPDRGSLALTPVLDGIRSRLDGIEARHPGFRLHLAGLASVAVPASQSMIREMGGTLLVAAIGVFVLMGLALRSVSLGLRSIVPNLLPMGVTTAGLVLLGQPLQYISAMALTICLGVAVDDTIHYLFRYRDNLRRGMVPVQAVREASHTVGTALLTSTAILVAGFAFLQTSEMPTIRLFGLLGMITLITALVADLVFLPALLLIAPRAARIRRTGRRRTSEKPLSPI